MKGIKIKKSYKIGTGIVILILLLIGIFSLSNGDIIRNKGSITGNIILDDSLKGNPNKVTIYFFWGEGCPHCITQKPHLKDWQEKYGNKIEVKMFETWKNPENVKLFKEVSSAYGIQARGVPTTFIGEKYWIGFSSSMASEMENHIQECVSNGCKNPLERS